MRGSPEQAPFSACYLRDGKLVAIDCINSIKDFMAAKKLITTGVVLDRARLADPAVALKDLGAAAA